MTRLPGSGPRDRHHARPALTLRALALLALAGALTTTVVAGWPGVPTFDVLTGTSPAFGQNADERAGGEGSPGEGGLGSHLKINPDGYTSARVCGRCHTDIYNSWKNSLHAFSLTDPIFDAAYMQALKEAGDEAKRLCLRCHAPMVMTNGDYDLQEAVTAEGVSCDFCHTVTAVHFDRPEAPYSADVGLVKRSVLRKAASPKHDVAYSELHGKAEFCGGCHNYVSPHGAPIMSTYDEWRRGPYADEGIQCQNCHMVLSSGAVVSKEVKQSGNQIHLHNLIHNTDQLRSALAIRILKAERARSGLDVEVQLANVGSGHMVPTGMPTREVVLEVQVEYDSHIVSRERRYRRVVADERGNVLERDFEILLRGAKVIHDNRIAPREERVERFQFAVPKTGSVKVSASVSYLYLPMVLGQRRLDIELARAERVVM